MNSTDIRKIRFRATLSVLVLMVLLAALAPADAQDNAAKKKEEEEKPAESIPAFVHDRIYFGDYGLNGRVETIDEYGDVTFAEHQGQQVQTDITMVKYMRLNRNAEIPADHFRMGFVFRLVDNTRFTGNIVEWGEKAFVVDSEYAGRVRIDREAVRYISTWYHASVDKLWNLPDRNVLILRGRTEPVPFKTIKARFCEPKDYARQIDAFEITKPDGAAETVAVGKIAGVVFAAPPAAAPAPPGWYAFVTVSNFDRLPGVVERLDAKALYLTTEFMGSLRIERSCVEYLVFSETPQYLRGHLLVCDGNANEIIEYDREMNRVWEQPLSYFASCATRLANGNILVVVPQQAAVYELNPQHLEDKIPEKQSDEPKEESSSEAKPSGTVKSLKVSGRQYKVVWRARVSDYHLSNPVFAKRLPNGNTLIAVEGIQGDNGLQIAEFDAVGTRIAYYFDGECEPTYVTQTAEGNLLICSINGRREVFEARRDGTVLRRWSLPRPSLAEPLPDGRIVVADTDGGHQIYMIEKKSDKAVRTRHLQIYEQRLSITDLGNLVYYIAPSNIPAILFSTPDGKVITCWRAPATLTNVHMTYID